MSLARIKTWAAAEVLTASDLNAEYNNILNYLNSGILTLTALLDLSSATAGQIKFPSTQNASSDANTLDDYKELTFTPGITINAVTTGITYGTQIGRGFKIGKFVFITTLHIVLTSKGVQVGNVVITGLPNAATSTTNAHSAFSFAGSALASVTGAVACYVSPSATNMSIQYLGTGTPTIFTDPNLTNTSEFIISGFYEAAG